MYNWMKQYSTTTRLSVVYMIRHCGRNTQLLKCYTWEFGLDFEKLVPTAHVHACVSWKGMPWSKPRGMSTNDKSGSEQDDAWYKHNSQNQSIHQFKSNQIKPKSKSNQNTSNQSQRQSQITPNKIKIRRGRKLLRLSIEVDVLTIHATWQVTAKWIVEVWAKFSKSNHDWKANNTQNVFLTKC